MYCVQNKIYCGVFNKSYIVNNYPSHLKFQGYVNNVLEDHCTEFNDSKNTFYQKINEDRTC